MAGGTGKVDHVGLTETEAHVPEAYIQCDNTTELPNEDFEVPPSFKARYRSKFYQMLKKWYHRLTASPLHATKMELAIGMTTRLGFRSKPSLTTI